MSLGDAEFSAAAPYYAEMYGVEVVYVRGASQETITAEVQLNENRVNGPDGAEITVRSRDYLITAADLSITPQVGDQIKQTIGGTVKIFEVMPVDNRCFEEVDSQEEQLLVHTKYAGSE